MSRDDLLRNAIESATAPIYATQKSDIVEYYRENYGKNWTVQAALDLSGAAKGSTAYKSAQRHFQGSRLDAVPKTAKAQAAQAERFKVLGEKLPPIGRQLKEGQTSITVTVKGTQPNNTAAGRQRTIEVTFSGNQATQFINDPQYASIWDEYGVEPDLFEDGDYEIEVSGVSAV
jgi:hypothetical protein